MPFSPLRALLWGVGLIANQCSCEWLAPSLALTDGGFHVRKRNPSMIDDPRDSLFDLSFLGLAFDFPLRLLFVFSSFVRCFGQCTSKLSSFLLFFYIFYIVFKIPSCAGVALQC